MSRERAGGRARVGAQAQLAFAMQQAFVDYRWIADTEVRVRRALSSRLEIGAGAAGVLIGVDRAIAERDRQCGARLEGHFRVNGEKGALGCSRATNGASTRIRPIASGPGISRSGSA